ncbi:hypothetical protein CL617_00875 [archaeon]|nr:hypothetical protein [archaeon]|tara:strand:- start:1645 stop:2031 length:387 start_codon:yes stop_codon:yes gene_type:complete
MAFGIIETIAFIVILASVLKLIVLAVSPNSWMNFARKLYSKPQAVSWISLVLAVIVLYYLNQAGITILQIFAVLAFVALIIVVGMAKHIGAFISYYEEQGASNILKEQWLYTLIWVALLVWGIKSLFF